MVILIGGESCTGKTVMAQKLLELYKIPYLSIDHLKMGLIRGDFNCGFTALDSNDSITNYLWSIVKGIIMTNIENDQHIIIEDCYLLPDKLNEFTTPYSKHIISLFIGFSQNYIEHNFFTDIHTHRCDIETRSYDEDRTILQFIEEHRRLKLVCSQHNSTYFEIEDKYEKEIENVYLWIDSQVEKQKSLSEKTKPSL